MEWIGENWELVAGAVLGLLALLRFGATFTKTPKDDAALDRVIEAAKEILPGIPGLLARFFPPKPPSGPAAAVLLLLLPLLLAAGCASDGFDFQSDCDRIEAIVVPLIETIGGVCAIAESDECVRVTQVLASFGPPATAAGCQIAGLIVDATQDREAAALMLTPGEEPAPAPPIMLDAGP